MKNYYADNAAANIPYNAWWFIRAMSRSGNNRTQLATPMNTTDGKLFIRSSSNNGVFGQWNELQQKFMQRARDNANTFSFTVQPNTTGSFRLGVLFQHDQSHPSMYIVSVGTGTTGTVKTFKVFGDTSSMSISSASINGDTLTINCSATAYGGCSLLWLD